MSIWGSAIYDTISIFMDEELHDFVRQNTYWALKTYSGNSVKLCPVKFFYPKSWLILSADICLKTYQSAKRMMWLHNAAPDFAFQFLYFELYLPRYSAHFHFMIDLSFRTNLLHSFHVLQSSGLTHGTDQKQSQRDMIRRLIVMIYFQWNLKFVI